MSIIIILFDCLYTVTSPIHTTTPRPTIAVPTTIPYDNFGSGDIDIDVPTTIPYDNFGSGDIDNDGPGKRNHVRDV
jgi:hypothetical protein